MKPMYEAKQATLESGITDAFIAEIFRSHNTFAFTIDQGIAAFKDFNDGKFFFAMPFGTVTKEGDYVRIEYDPYVRIHIWVEAWK